MTGVKCNCRPSVAAWAYDKRTPEKIRKTCAGGGALAEAKGCRAEVTAAVRWFVERPSVV